MRVGIVGCGYVSAMYCASLQRHPEVEVACVYDRVEERAQAMSQLTSARRCSSLDELLEDDVEVVVNLTNPANHYEVTRYCLDAGKHVYTEKPVAMELERAKELVDLAESRALQITSAPCTLLNSPAQTAWHAIDNRVVGPIRLVYAEMDGGMVHRMPVHRWVNAMGVPWPYRDEFETGCTIEHAGYVLTWLAAYFGPAERISAFSTCIVPDKIPDETVDSAPDYSVANINFRSGIVARLTCSLYPPADLTIRMFGDDGVVTIENSRSDRSRVFTQRYKTIRRKRFLSPLRSRCPRAEGFGPKTTPRGAKHRDFCRGIGELINAIETHRMPYMTAQFCLHVNEMTLAIHNALEESTCYHMTTTFQPFGPLSRGRPVPVTTEA